MAIGLNQAENNRPLYIVDIRDADLENWLSLAGVEAGDSIWKSIDVENASSVWTVGQWGQVIISPRIASDMLVQRESGTICTLDQLSTGHTGKVIGHKYPDAFRLFWDVAKIKVGCILCVKKKFSPLVFHIDTDTGTLSLDDEAVFNTWMKEDGQWIQLGAIHVGRPFRVALFTGYGNAKHGTKKILGELLPMVSIRKIELHRPMGTDLKKILIKTESGKPLSLTEEESEKIKVRFCDICWSCGICR
jgi:hypothetical protein